MISVNTVLVLSLAAAGQASGAPPAKAPSTAPFPDPQSVDEFIKAVESPTSSYYLLGLAAEDPRKMETLLRAAQKQAPSRQPWATFVTTLFYVERSEALRLPAAARTALFRHALIYLQEWRDLTAAAARKAPGDKQVAETLVQLNSDLAVAALEAGQLDAARKYATEMLAANTDAKSWNYGNIIHEMNQVLGRVALRQGNRDEARRALLAAGATPGSPQLDSFGPSLVLARELLEKGEKDVVLQYLDSVATFWRHDNRRRPDWREHAAKQTALLAKWKQEIRAGKIPADGNWRP